MLRIIILRFLKICGHQPHAPNPNRKDQGTSLKTSPTWATLPQCSLFRVLWSTQARSPQNKRHYWHFEETCVTYRYFEVFWWGNVGSCSIFFAFFPNGTILFSSLRLVVKICQISSENLRILERNGSLVRSSAEVCPYFVSSFTWNLKISFL